MFFLSRHFQLMSLDSQCPHPYGLLLLPPRCVPFGPTSNSIDIVRLLTTHYKRQPRSDERSPSSCSTMWLGALFRKRTKRRGMRYSSKKKKTTTTFFLKMRGSWKMPSCVTGKSRVTSEVRQSGRGKKNSSLMRRGIAFLIHTWVHPS